MANEKSLIIKLLDSLAAKYGEMSFVYGYDGFLDQHIVEVQPREKFDNEEYLIDEVHVTAEFIASYPDKGLVFISNDPYLKVENPVYQTTIKDSKSATKRNTSTAKSFWGNWGRGSLR